MQNHLQKLLGKLSPRGRFKKWLAFWFVFILVGWGVYFLFDLLEPERVLVTISKETTYVTEYLKASGYPDYIAAFNQIQKQDVTAENNIFTPLFEVGGYDYTEVTAKTNDKSKSADANPTKNQYLQSYDDFIQNLPENRLPAPNAKEKKFEYEPERITMIRSRVSSEEEKLNRPWKDEDYPFAAEWLAKQEPILEKLNGIENRTAYFLPAKKRTPTQALFISAFNGLNAPRRIAYALSVRSMNYYAKGDRKKAWRDIKTQLHIAGQCGKHPFLLDQMMSIALESMATETAMNYVVQDPANSLEGLEEMQREYNAIPLANITRSYDIGERMMYLNLIADFAEFGVPGDASWKERDEILKKRPSFYARKKWDYDLILRSVNETFDELVKITSLPDRDKQKAAGQKLIAETQAKIEQIGDSAKISKTAKFFSSRRTKSERVALTTKFAAVHMINIIFRKQDEQLMQRELHNFGFEMAKYFKKNGKYPVTDEELKSAGIMKIPKDVFTNKPCVFKPDREGFLLYSLGWSEQDSGGYSGMVNDVKEHFNIAVYSLNREPKAPPKQSDESPSDENPPQDAPGTAPTPMSEEPKAPADNKSTDNKTNDKPSEK